MVKWEPFIYPSVEYRFSARGKKPQPKARGRGVNPHLSQDTLKSHRCSAGRRWRISTPCHESRTSPAGRPLGLVCSPTTRSPSGSTSSPPPWLLCSASCFRSRPRVCGQRCPPVSCSPPFSVHGCDPRSSLCPQTSLLLGFSFHWAPATLSVFLIMHIKHSKRKAINTGDDR